MPKRTPALLLAEALTFHGRYGAETEDQATHRRLQRNQMAATELLRLDALRLELQTQLADYKEACTKAETRADQAQGRAKLLTCAWIKATDAVPQESDGEVFVRFTDGSIGTGWATYWHGASNDFARWTFPDPDEFRLVSEWAKNVPASIGASFANIAITFLEPLPVGLLFTLVTAALLGRRQSRRSAATAS